MGKRGRSLTYREPPTTFSPLNWYLSGFSAASERSRKTSKRAVRTMCLKKVTFCVVCQEYRLLAPAGAPIKTCQTRVSVQEIPCRQPECRRNETIFPWLTGSFRPSDIRRTCGWRGCSENCCRYDVIYNPCCGNRPSNVVYQVRKNPRPGHREVLKSNL